MTYIRNVGTGSEEQLKLQVMGAPSLAVHFCVGLATRNPCGDEKQSRGREKRKRNIGKRLRRNMDGQLITLLWFSTVIPLLRL